MVSSASENEETGQEGERPSYSLGPAVRECGKVICTLLSQRCFGQEDPIIGPGQ